MSDNHDATNALPVLKQRIERLTQRVIALLESPHSDHTPTETRIILASQLLPYAEGLIIAAEQLSKGVPVEDDSLRLAYAVLTRASNAVELRFNLECRFAYLVQAVAPDADLTVEIKEDASNTQISVTAGNVSKAILAFPRLAKSVLDQADLALKDAIMFEG